MVYLINASKGRAATSLLDAYLFELMKNLSTHLFPLIFAPEKILEIFHLHRPQKQDVKPPKHTSVSLAKAVNSLIKIIASYVLFT